MATRLFITCLSVSLLLSASIYFLYRGYGWPLGTEGIEALGATAVLFVVWLGCLISAKKRLIHEKSIHFGLLIGLLWTAEISMNNILRPPLPERDIYDDIFWAIIALLLLVLAFSSSLETRQLANGIKVGFWSGLASGAVACLTALLFIVFGMNLLLLDPLNVAEWSQRGAASGTPNISVYFAYQTLAGALIHLVVLGMIMGLLLGIIGGVFGKGAAILFRRPSVVTGRVKP